MVRSRVLHNTDVDFRLAKVCSKAFDASTNTVILVADDNGQRATVTGRLSPSEAVKHFEAAGFPVPEALRVMAANSPGTASLKNVVFDLG